MFFGYVFLRRNPPTLEIRCLIWLIIKAQLEAEYILLEKRKTSERLKYEDLYCTLHNGAIRLT